MTEIIDTLVLSTDICEKRIMFKSQSGLATFCACLAILDR